MNKDSILFLTKDVCCKDYLPCYKQNCYWEGKMPNLDELAAKGTIFNNFFTAAPSSNMSYRGMFTMLFPHEQTVETYKPLDQDFEGDTLFDKATKAGYECHVVWDISWEKDNFVYARCYGKNTTLHSIPEFRQKVGSHYIHEGKLVNNDELAAKTVNTLREELKSFMDPNKKIFVWCHIPHVLKGRVEYGGDMDVYDQCIGVFREFFSDDNIFISADHGNMNGLKGKIGYGFDVYEPAICIPLIGPRINNMPVCNQNISNVDIYELLFNRTIPQREFLFSDSAYYAQPHRKTAVIWGKYRYIYNKLDKSEELYDVEWDPNENFNLISDTVYDVDRHVSTPACEYYFYPHWDELPQIREMLRNEKNKMWRDAKLSQNLYFKLKRKIATFYLSLKKKKI